MTPVSMSNLRIDGNKLYIKREDLLPFSFGRNKVRISEKFIDDMYRKNKNYMIGYGNTKSNLSRALACMCVSKNIPCTIISVVNEGDYEQT